MVYYVVMHVKMLTVWVCLSELGAIQIHYDFVALTDFDEWILVVLHVETYTCEDTKSSAPIDELRGL